MSPNWPTLTHACPHKLFPSPRKTAVLKLISIIRSQQMSWLFKTAHNSMFGWEESQALTPFQDKGERRSTLLPSACYL